MELSEKLKQYDSCGDFGRNLQGLSEMADALEIRLDNIESQLASALAANQVMREALKGAKEFFDSDGDISCRSEMMIATAVRNALAIKPGDVELVEVGEYEIADGMFIFHPDQSKCAPVEYENSKLYTIKTKERV